MSILNEECWGGYMTKIGSNHEFNGIVHLSFDDKYFNEG